MANTPVTLPKVRPVLLGIGNALLPIVRFSVKARLNAHGLLNLLPVYVLLVSDNLRPFPENIRNVHGTPPLRKVRVNKNEPRIGISLLAVARYKKYGGTLLAIRPLRDTHLSLLLEVLVFKSVAKEFSRV